jgi:hypothetical protein
VGCPGNAWSIPYLTIMASFRHRVCDETTSSRGSIPPGYAFRLQTRFPRLETGIPRQKLKLLRMQPMWREASNQSRWSPPVLAGRPVLGGSSPARGGRARWAEGGRGDEASRGRDIGDAALARSPRHSVITSSPSGSKNAAVVASGSSKDAAVRVPQDMPDLPRAVSLPRTSLSRPRVRTPRTRPSCMLSCRSMCHCWRSRSCPCP